MNFGLGMVEKVKESEDRENRHILIKYKKYYDTSFRYTWRHSNNLILVVAAGEQPLQIPDFFLAGEDSDEGEDGEGDEAEELDGDAEDEATDDEDQIIDVQPRKSRKKILKNTEQGIPSWEILREQLADSLPDVDKVLDIESPEESDGDDDSLPPVLGFKDGQWVNLSSSLAFSEQPPGPVLMVNNTFMMPDDAEEVENSNSDTPAVLDSHHGPEVEPDRAEEAPALENHSHRKLTKPNQKRPVRPPPNRGQAQHRAPPHRAGQLAQHQPGRRGQRRPQNPASGNQHKKPGPVTPRAKGLNLPRRQGPATTGQTVIVIPDKPKIRRSQCRNAPRCRASDRWMSTFLSGVVTGFLLLLLFIGRATAQSDTCVDKWGYDFDQVEKQHELFQQWREEMKDCDTGPHLLYGLTPLVITDEIRRGMTGVTTYADLFRKCRNGGFQIPFFPASSLTELYEWLRAQDIPDTDEESGVAAPVYVVGSEIRWLRGRAKAWFSTSLLKTITTEEKKAALKQVSIKPNAPGSTFSAAVDALASAVPTDNSTKSRRVICFPEGSRMQRTYGAWDSMLQLFHDNNCFRREDKLFSELNDLVRNQSGAGKPCQGRRAVLLDTNLAFFKTRPDAANSYQLLGVPQELERLEENFLSLSGQLRRAIGLLKESDTTASANTEDLNRFWKNVKEGKTFHTFILSAGTVGGVVTICCLCCIARYVKTRTWPTLMAMCFWCLKPIRTLTQSWAPVQGNEPPPPPSNRLQMNSTYQADRAWNFRLERLPDRSLVLRAS